MCELHGTHCEYPDTVESVCDSFGAVCLQVSMECPCDGCTNR